MCSGKSDHFLPHMWHPSLFTQSNWKPVIYDIVSQLVTNPSTYVTQKCQICEQIKCCMHSKTFLNGPPMDWSNTVTLVRCSIYRGLIHGNLPLKNKGHAFCRGGRIVIKVVAFVVNLYVKVMLHFSGVGVLYREWLYRLGSLHW